MFFLLYIDINTFSSELYLPTMCDVFRCIFDFLISAKNFNNACYIFQTVPHTNHFNEY